MTKFQKIINQVDRFYKYAQEFSGVSDTSAAKIASELVKQAILSWLPGRELPAAWHPLLTLIKECSIKSESLTDADLDSLLSAARKMIALPINVGGEDKREWDTTVVPTLQSLIETIGNMKVESKTPFAQ